MGRSRPPVPPPFTALVVAHKGPSRRALAQTVRDLGLEVSTASDPYEATARFAEAPADLVIASLAGWRRRDLAFLTAVRGRSPSASILLLVPDRERVLLPAALRTGADGYLPEPVDLDALRALAARQLSRRADRRPAGPDAALRALCAEVGHAVNNPLQVATLLLDAHAAALDPAVREGLARELSRIRDAVEIVASYGGLTPPRRVRIDLKAFVADALAAPARTAHLAEPPTVTGDPLDASLDPDLVRAALETAAGSLLGRLPEGTPTRLQAVVRTRAVKGKRYVEVAVRVRGVHLDGPAADAAREAVVEVDERTRIARPGLALARAVTEAHGGGLDVRRTEAGTVLGLRFPPG